LKKGLFIAALACLAAIYGIKSFHRYTLEKHSRHRVEGMLSNLQKGRIADEQDAIGFWHTGYLEAPSEATANQFANWRSQRHLDSVQTYSLVSSKVPEASNAAVQMCEIEFVVNGRHLRIRARDGVPLEWID
jgi:hypothetical protein